MNCMTFGDRTWENRPTPLWSDRRQKRQPRHCGLPCQKENFLSLLIKWYTIVFSRLKSCCMESTFFSASSTIKDFVSMQNLIFSHSFRAVATVWVTPKPCNCQRFLCFHSYRSQLNLQCNPVPVKHSTHRTVSTNMKQLRQLHAKRKKVVFPDISRLEQLMLSEDSLNALGLPRNFMKPFTSQV